MIKVFGYCDDCIGIEGDEYKECYLYGEDPALLVFSDGSSARIRYDGDWLIDNLDTPVGASFRFLGVGKSEENGYTDELTIYNASWVKIIQGNEVVG